MDNNKLKIYKHGTPVQLLLSKAEGLITAVTMRGTYISYEISYYLDGKHDVKWFDESEFDTNASKRTIGYK